MVDAMSDRIDTGIAKPDSPLAVAIFFLGCAA
jgi:hypothetical protein